MKPSLTLSLQAQYLSFRTIPEGGGMWSSGFPSTQSKNSPRSSLLRKALFLWKKKSKLILEIILFKGIGHIVGCFLLFPHALTPQNESNPKVEHISIFSSICVFNLFVWSFA